MMLLFRTFCVFVCVFSLCYGQRGVKEGRRRHQQHREREQRERERQLLLENIREDEGLFPSVLNLASRALISSNATCGEAGPERYCKLVEHGAQREPQCGVCDARARDTARRHPPELAIDGSNRWWQSPSLHQGSHFQWVTLTLDLRQVFEVAYVIVKSGISPRPGNWILERSLDGINFSAWQYYALSDPECESWFGVVATKGRPTYRDDTEVICTSYFSKLDPLEGGEIHTSLVNGRPGANGSSSALREFTRARYIRLRLQRIRTLYADLMSLAGDDLPGRAPEPGRGDQPIGNPGGKADASVTQRYFYSIKDISIGGQCVCHGHASDCPLDKESGVQACRCRHNTCGSSCERCCPLYNQQVWRAGSVGDAAKCEPCQCHGHASSCVFDPEVARNRLSLDTKGERRGGGVCQDCRDHTTGVNCEICSDGYFRPPGVSRDNPHPCRPCQCHPAGCPSGRCASVADDGEEQVQLPGQCECRPGFTGRHCDKCAPGYRGFPNCVTCPCNLAGTQLDQQADCEEDCRCKENVEGVKCDRCKPGFFALDAERPEGCVACFCSGVAGATCKEARLSIQSGELDTESGWSVTDLTRTTFVAAIRTASGALEFAADDLPFLAEDYFWSAPPLPYLSGLLTSYGQKLTVRVSWVSVRGDTSGRPTMCADLVLVGDGFTIGTASTQHTGNNATIAVTLREEGWQHMLAPDQGTPVTRTEFLRVLAGLQHVMIRAKFHTDQIEGRLNLASLERGLEGEGEGVAARHIEECSCPLGYSGLSCERCQNGFRRVNNTLQGGLCLPCDCHGHAPTCDPFTGSCGECEDNAEGEMCELCKPGYYGDARLGRPDSCRRCSCPLEEPASNNVSPTCEADLNDPREYTCNACARGYEGRHCERCAPGFWGNPLQPGSECKPCECQGGTALQPGAQQGPSCDPLTGRCLRCRGNTVGWRCESCLPGHYGSPEMADCRPCKCDPEGSDGSSCDSRSGQCTCRPHVTGRTCDRCEEGRGGISAGCPTCQCHPEGSLNGDCDARSGQCPCRPGVGGKRCDHCLPNHYGLSRDGCHRCACDPSGSDGTQCDIVTGQCRCKPNVEGRACNKCRLGYWDISSRQGCVPCACDQVGCAGGHCDPDSGQCACRPGVTGRACERCKHGFYGFSTSGCKECEPCNKPGHICDPDTGRCVCPMLTEGPACERCRTGAYNHEVGVGCKACGCHSAGSQGAQCDGRTGVCPCRPGFSAPKCDSCMPGFYGFPRCRPCECHVPGTTRSSCPFGQPCGCDDTGQCQCKSNVVGKRCEHCKRGTFSLQADNPEGCTTCFCFNRATQCTQAQLVWSQVRMLSPRSVSIEYDSDTPQFHPGSPILPVNTQEICYINLAIPGGTDMNITQTDGTSVKLNVSNNLRIIPGDAGNVRIGVSYLFDTPLYWKLPRNFIGDKVVSYNGYLRFTTKATGGQTLLPPTVLESYPLVQLQGNNKIVLEYFAPQTSPTGQYQVRFHEAWWRAKNSLQSGAVTRETMMLALQNVQHILIRATDSVDFKTLELRDVSMDFAVQPRPTHDGTALSVPAWQLARGVEQCECLHEYRATSCQNPSIGFYRWLPPPHHTESTIIIQLLGESRPCACASRSATCDPETGACVNCTENTAGPACDRCAAGFFGDPKQAPCRPCPCPNPHNNRASSCVVGREIQCRCQPGYTGPRCERCAYGYFGYPLSVGGSCQPCECDVRGSVSDECHEETGQCNCRPGVEGRDCTVCPPRHVLGERGCVTCNDKCTGVLLQELQTLSLRLAELNMTGLSPAPWGRVYKIERHVQGPLRQELDAWLRFMATDLPVDAEEEMRRRTRQLQAKSKRLSEESHNVAQDADKTRQDAQGLLDETRDMQSDTEAVVANLRQYGRHDETTSFSISAALREAGLLLDKITSVNLSKPRKNADHALKKAREQLVGLQDMLSSGELEDASDAIQERLRDIVTRLMDLEKHARAANEALDQTSRMNKYNSAARDTTSELIPRIEDLAQTEKETALERNRLNKDGQELLQEARENFEELSRLVMEVSKVSQMVEHREGILARLNPLYKRQYVTPAAEHAAELMRQARLYNDRFNATREVASFALKAAQAYQGIVSAIEEGIKSSEEAKLSADKAYERAFPSGTAGADALVNRAREARKHSEALNLQAKDVGRRAEVLRTRLAQQRAGVQNLGDRLSIAGERHDGVLRDLDHLSSNVRTVTLAALEKSSASNEKIKETLGQVDQVSEKIENELRPVLKRLASENSPALALAASDIEKARKNMRDANTLLAGINRDAATQNARMAQWNDTLSEQLQQLRDSIAQARHAANGIRLSLGSAIGRNCIRSYKARIEPATTSNIVVTFAPSRAGDGVILLLRSDPTLSKDFLALELRDKRVKLSWDLGGGLGYVIHPLPVKPASNLANDSSWFRAEVDRTGHVARLYVRSVISPSSEWPEPARNASPAGFNRLDAGPGATLWLGGYGGLSSSRPEGIVPTSMPGCIHQVWFDGSPLGLWDFLTTSGPETCTACIEGVEEIRDEQAFSFLGDGYSVLNLESNAPYNPYQYSVSMAFRTFDEDALLFLAVNPKRDRFITVALRGGRVHYRVDYGGGSRLELTTSQRYNTGEQVRFEAARHFDRRKKLERGLLRVGAEEHSGAPSLPPGVSSLPDLAQGTYLVGGAPPGFMAPSNLPPPELRSFRGCVSDLQVINEGYNLLLGTFYAVEPGCPVDVVKVVSFAGDGYLELPGQTLGRKASLGLVFATTQPDALLLLSEPVYHEAGQAASFYSVSLLRGQLHVRVGAGKGNVTVRSGNTFNDGLPHSVSVIKTNRRLELLVDDKSVSATKLAEGSQPEVRAKKGSGLYLGGLPNKMVRSSSGLAASVDSLSGLIRDLVIADTLLSMAQPVSFSHAGIGRSKFPALSPVTVMSVSTNGVRSLPDRAGPTHCEPSRAYSVEHGAVKFGDKPHSHVVLQKLWPQRNGVPRNFTLHFDFRTHYPNGLLFLMPAFRPKQRHFVRLEVHNSHLEITLANPKKEIKMRTKAPLNDGEWHSVEFVKVGQNVQLKVDGKEVDRKKGPKKLNVLSTAYVGGLPETNSIAPLIGSVCPGDCFGQDMEDFKGCLRNVKVQGRIQDLVGQRSYSYNVGQCFPRVETGSFFPGDAYAIYQNMFEVGTMLELELEFRTAELNGVLLSVSEPLGYPALSLELLDGQVFLSGDMGNRKPFRVQQTFSSKFTACDNRWHHVQAFYINDSLMLRVDQQTTNYGHSLNGGLKASQTNSSLYIGGLPDSAPSGTLQTRDNFKGCIRNVAINRERRDWTDMVSLHNVLLSACPLSSN